MDTTTATLYRAAVRDGRMVSKAGSLDHAIRDRAWYRANGHPTAYVVRDSDGRPVCVGCGGHAYDERTETSEPHAPGCQYDE